MESLADESGSESTVGLTTLPELVGESDSWRTAGAAVGTESDLSKTTEPIGAESGEYARTAAVLTGLMEGALTERARTIICGEYGVAKVSMEGNLGLNGVSLSNDDNGGSTILGVDVKVSNEGNTGLCLSGVVESIMKEGTRVRFR